jgi:hypothetical protein
MSRRSGFLLVVAWALVGALLVFASWLTGQQRTPGTGYHATHASWEKQDGRRLVTFEIDHDAHPWGPGGGPPGEDAVADAPNDALYRQRYAGGGPQPSYEDPAVPGSKVYGRGIGAWGEAMGPQIVPALKRWYAQQSPQHQAQWDGEPTVEEAYDAAFSQPRLGSFYRAPVVDPTPTPRPSPSPSPTPVSTPTSTPPPPVVTPTPEPTCEPLDAGYQSRLDAFLLKLATWPVKAGSRRYVTWRETVEAKALRGRLPSTGLLSTCLAEVP